MQASNPTTPEGKIYDVDLLFKHFAILRRQTMLIDRSTSQIANSIKLSFPEQKFDLYKCLAAKVSSGNSPRKSVESDT
ncbi:MULTISPECIES: hypothetical protein [unclassified Microcoleus]|uniref:hypothetical protein n=1 Tax=unclassified Microcoleus TaxID=2642155 RepID=UPI00312B523E